jgi:hypothetical protein
MPRLRFVRLLLGLFAGAVALAGGGKLLLGTGFAARQVVARLRDAVGAPVRIGDMSLGYTGSSLRDVEVLEAVGTKEPPRWSSCRTVDAGLSLWQLLRGDMAGGVVTLRDAAVTLRFDADNRLVTRLPVPKPTAASLPVVRLDGGQLTIQKDGVPDSVFRGIALELRGDGERLTLSGTFNDPEWGEWAVGGGQDAATGPFTLELRTVRPIHATPDLLRKAPFVPPVTWHNVECEGDTPCEVVVHLGGVAPRTHYRVVLDPTNTKVCVPIIHLAAEAARGRVVVEDDVVTLEGVRGLAAGGELRVGSHMDFTGDPQVLKFGIEAQALNPRRLPDSWQVPAVEGKVSGRADLEVVIRAGHRTAARGSGEGSIQMFSFLPPIRLHLEATERGFRITRGKRAP